MLGCKLLDSRVRRTFATVACLIRMAHKYQMVTILEGAITRVRFCFPDTFEKSCVLLHHGSPFVTFEGQDAIEADNLAHLTQTDSVLPSALFICATLPTMLLVNGVSRVGGRKEHLSPEDLIRCLRRFLSSMHTSKCAWVIRDILCSPT